MDAPELLIRGNGLDRFWLAPTARAIPEANDYWDGNWIWTTVRARVGGFHADYEGQLRMDEFADFGEQLKSLYSVLKGEAVFRTMEEWLTITVRGDGMGHTRALCLARDRPGGANSLSVQLEFDQTEIPRMLSELDSILTAFPIRGERRR